MSTDTDEGVVVSLRLPREELVKRTDRLAYKEREAAELLGISFRQMQDLRRSRKIKSRKIGREHYFSRKALEQFIDGEDA